MKKELKPPKTIPSSVYTREYFTSCCQGHQEFAISDGELLPARISVPLNLIEIVSGMRILDIGCGRGELALHAARQEASVWALDYAREAVQLAYENLDKISSPENRARIVILQANGRRLPFPAASLDAIFMLDVVEHLYPEELDETFQDVRRVLCPSGKLIIHTMPNLWYYHYGYPIYRALQRLRGEKKLPKDPRDRWAFRDVHVNEQTPTKIRTALVKNGFETRVWLQTTQDYDYEGIPIVRWGMNFLTRVYPLRWIFCNDIFAVATKV